MSIFTESARANTNKIEVFCRRLSEIPAEELKTIFQRETLQLSGIIRDVIEPMAKRFEQDSFEALQYYSQKYDGAVASKAILDAGDLERAYKKISEQQPELIGAFKKAIDNITAFHLQQKPANFSVEVAQNQLSMLYKPMQNVALYVPGGKAVYPSTVMMGAIPAKIAGVESLTVVSPPQADGQVNEVVQAVAHMTGVTQILQYGGAQAVLACALGVEAIGLKPCDFIAGPGNVYVAAAKSFCFANSYCGIDSFAGPSEVVIIADITAQANYLAHDFMAQAEHDENASAILLIDDENLAKQVVDEIEEVLTRQKTFADEKRLAITRDAVSRNGKIIIVDSLQQAVEFSNRYAPEHLEIQTQDDDALCAQISSAGSVFLGHYAPVAVGDYYSGTNHILPTSGAARFASGVGVLTFMKRITVQKCSPEGLRRAAQPIALMSKAEGLFAEHGYSVLTRFDDLLELYTKKESL